MAVLVPRVWPRNCCAGRYLLSLPSLRHSAVSSPGWGWVAPTFLGKLLSGLQRAESFPGHADLPPSLSATPSCVRNGGGGECHWPSPSREKPGGRDVRLSGACTQSTRRKSLQQVNVLMRSGPCGPHKAKRDRCSWNLLSNPVKYTVPKMGKNMGYH